MSMGWLNVDIYILKGFLNHPPGLYSSADQVK